MEKEIKKLLLKKFTEKTFFTTEELKRAIQKFNTNLSSNACSWWIHKLKKEGFIIRIGRGVYTFHEKKDYFPELSHKAKQFYNRIKQFLPNDTIILIYENYSIAEMLSIPFKNHYIFIHIPKENLEMFFYDIIHLGKRVFLKPSKEVTERYITPFKEAVILYPLLKDMPVININNYNTLSIEGILVHSLIFGSEYYRARKMDLKDVFKITFQKYNVNISKLIRYASRRERKKEVLALLYELNII